MGPFKHTVDDGLDVRKAAFECMYTLLDSCLEGLDVLQFLDHVEEGLKDHYDIRVGRKQRHQIIRVTCRVLLITLDGKHCVDSQPIKIHLYLQGHHLA